MAALLALLGVALVIVFIAFAAHPSYRCTLFERVDELARHSDEEVLKMLIWVNERGLHPRLFNEHFKTDFHTHILPRGCCGSLSSDPSPKTAPKAENPGLPYGYVSLERCLSPFLLIKEMAERGVPEDIAQKVGSIFEISGPWKDSWVREYYAANERRVQNGFKPLRPVRLSESSSASSGPSESDYFDETSLTFMRPDGQAPLSHSSSSADMSLSGSNTTASSAEYVTRPRPTLKLTLCQLKCDCQDCEDRKAIPKSYTNCWFKDGEGKRPAKGDCLVEQDLVSQFKVMARWWNGHKYDDTDSLLRMAYCAAELFKLGGFDYNPFKPEEWSADESCFEGKWVNKAAAIEAVKADRRELRANAQKQAAQLGMTVAAWAQLDFVRQTPFHFRQELKDYGYAKDWAWAKAINDVLGFDAVEVPPYPSKPDPQPRQLPVPVPVPKRSQPASKGAPPPADTGILAKSMAVVGWRKKPALRSSNASKKSRPSKRA